ncbi:MAG: peptide chain release factor 1 [Pseudodesulfovibrio sp.]|uniref:Peptide chain release factor 1 n=1 Tax=Pseudodesulfovibrio aespoeensis (strain ATCC 700646 / DSM 10631 / Aspo-2) TaxID=643562 RepID=E6VVC4_PSEA9|nr:MULTISPECIES: peptide chain release factor 1 [Pseudodesulfovibrio]MBU4377702.1 peptide chain release factor 1 [Pseudomonadota bacterium]ADU62368.1 peptide chain release factor 1 [Pseudodesulfovibrio aespoeensis Aspo-2]MBU4473968.1 peptide chain release factor 1 [Pseudomonadota bacterium]MBU4515166.1 peptide chain release factor 1 [Pseudomonadota bacterium]MBU4521071.1 peptide chain release factor 1 [Pseudomonadota bacterium]
MFGKLEDIEIKYDKLEYELAQPGIFNDQERYKKVSKAHSDLSDVVVLYREYKKCSKDLAENREMSHDPDPEIREMAKAEISELEDRIETLEEKIKILLLPSDPMDEKNIILEIRAGTGGDEAGLFAADLYRMYTRYAEANRWKVEEMSSNVTGSGGLKEVIASIAGDKVYSKLKYESGTHRVQRVPATESQGRIHTSVVTVAIMPEAEEVDIDLRPEDVRVDVFRSSGPGGQSVNTTDSAIRVTHIPTGMIVICQDEKSQHKNKAKALKVLRSRLLQLEQDKAKAEEDAARRIQVGSGDRSERIRTYNFPQGRVSDHRINLTLHKLPQILEGELDDLTDALIGHYQAEAMKRQGD